jgi:hydroxymethylpyrimidine/phosphomethylpyrimidine kinase
MLRDQIDAVMEDIGTDAVKIGMLHAPDIVRTVASAIDRHKLVNVVFDPVMVATSGAVLIDDSAIHVLVQELFPRACVVTPNLDEAALLVGFALTDVKDMARAAQVLLDKGAQAVLLKGGHLPGDVVIDLLVTRQGKPLWMEAPRIHSPNTHGTGCTLSSAIAAYLALGASLEDAVQQARFFVRQALQAGANVRTGRGSGPLNHGFAPEVMHVMPMSDGG